MSTLQNNNYYIYLLIFNNDIILNTTKIIKLIITIVEPVGYSFTNDKVSPTLNDIILITTLDITTLLSDLKYCIEDSVGKIIKLDIKSDPISLIPKTTTIEHKHAKIIL